MGIKQDLLIFIMDGAVYPISCIKTVFKFYYKDPFFSKKGDLVFEPSPILVNLKNLKETVV